MALVRSQRSLQLKVSEVKGEAIPTAPLDSCPYCEATMPGKATVCRACRRSLPEVVLLKGKILCCLVGVLTFFASAAERFYRLRLGDILWLNFDSSPAKYLEWLIADPGPFILGLFICGCLLDYYWWKLTAR